MQYWPRDVIWGRPALEALPGLFAKKPIYLWHFRSFLVSRGTRHGEVQSPLAPGPLQWGSAEAWSSWCALKCLWARLGGEMPREFPICWGSGCSGASSASGRSTPELLVRVTSRNNAIDVGVPKAGGRGVCTGVWEANICSEAPSPGS